MPSNSTTGESPNGNARPSGSNRLPILAVEISAAHVMCVNRGHEFVQAAVDAGKLLLEAKELVPHGEWVPWLAANAPNVSARTSQRYMRAARNAGEKRHVSLLPLRHLVRPAVRAQAPDVNVAAIVALLDEPAYPVIEAFVKYLRYAGRDAAAALALKMQDSASVGALL